MPRRFAILLTIGALLLTPMTLLAQAGGANAPKLDVPEKIKDFGNVPQGEVIHATFKLVNEGSAKLVVKAVRPTCGCTVAEYDKEVAPGRAGLVKAKVDTVLLTLNEYSFRVDLFWACQVAVRRQATVGSWWYHRGGGL